MKYVCTRDLQGGTFAVGSIHTVEGWKERALGWCESDDNEELADSLERITNEKDIMIFIADFWELEFMPYEEHLEKILTNLVEYLEDMWRVTDNGKKRYRNFINLGFTEEDLEKFGFDFDFSSQEEEFNYNNLCPF